MSIIVVIITNYFIVSTVTMLLGPAWQLAKEPHGRYCVYYHL